MKIGVPKEIKNGECRVALTPNGAQTLLSQGHTVLLEKSSGVLAGFPDREYARAGARLVSDAQTVWKKSDLILKVKEPQSSEYPFLSPNKILFCFLHCAASISLTRALLRSGVSAIAGETIQDASGRLPLLEPMSEIAGRMAVIIGAYYQSTCHGGGGILISGLPGVLSAKVVILGGGTVGENAAKIASGMGAQVTILDHRQDRLRLLDELLPENVSTLHSTPQNILKSVSDADILIGAVLIPGAKAPKLVTRKMIKQMRAGTVFVDVSIDQGGVAETSRATTHAKPTFRVDGVLHYCVPNMPGAYGRSATLAHADVSLKYIEKLANRGLGDAFREDPGFASGLNTHAGKVTHPAVAESLSLPYSPF
ncbi:MAG: alanine dehydrogenase [Elusimicrobia bacterium]|nr:alanine dehydrogenase [Elusimicrobiota bacterium]